MSAERKAGRWAFPPVERLTRVSPAFAEAPHALCFAPAASLCEANVWDADRAVRPLGFTKA